MLPHQGLEQGWLFSGEARDILLRQSRLAHFLQDLVAKALILVPPTELEIFQQHLVAKAIVLVNPTVLEIFYQGFDEKPYFWSILQN